MSEPNQNAKAAIRGQLDDVLTQLGQIQECGHCCVHARNLQSMLGHLSTFITGLKHTFEDSDAATPERDVPPRKSSPHQAQSRWDSAAQEVLQQIFHVTTLDRQTHGAVRLVCRSWRSVLDSSLAVLELSSIPDEQQFAIIAKKWPALITVDFSKLNKDSPVQFGRVVRLLDQLSTITTLRNIIFSRHMLTISKGILQQGLQALEVHGHRAPWHRTVGDSDYVVALPDSITKLSQLRHIAVLDVPRHGPRGFAMHDGGVRNVALDCISVLGNLSTLSNLQSINLCVGVKPAGQMDHLAKHLTNLEQHSATVTADQLLRFTKLKRLALHNCANNLSHKQLSMALPAMPLLEELALCHSHALKEVPPSISRLTLLHTLDLSLNNLQTLPPQLSCLTRLTSLSVSGNQLRIFPDALMHLTGLKKLDLSKNSWRMDVLLHSPAFHLFCTRASLTDLNMSLSHLAVCPHSLMCIESLQHLQLERNRLRSLPSFLSRLTNLVTLDLSYNQIEAMPCLTDLTRLRHLNVYSNSLQQLPLPKVACLRYLNAAHNRLTQVPPRLSTHTQLNYLNLSHNPVSCPHMALGRLGQLQDLQLQGLGADCSNHLPGYSPVLLVRLDWDAVWRDDAGAEACSSSSPPPAERHLNLSLLENLEQLNLSNNLLKAVPPNLSQLRKLLHLNLFNAALSSLDSALWELCCLTHLDLSANHIRSLPDQVSELQALKLLDLSSNALQSVSANIWTLRSLQVLGLCANRLTQLPDVRQRQSRLQVLDLRFNTFHELPHGLHYLSSLSKLLVDTPLDTWPAAARLKLAGVGVSTAQQLSVQHYASHLLHGPPPPIFVSHMVRLFDDSPRPNVAAAAAVAGDVLHPNGMDPFDAAIDVLHGLPGLPWEMQNGDVVALMGLHDHGPFAYMDAVPPFVMPPPIIMQAMEEEEEMNPFLPQLAELFGASDEGQEHQDESP